MKPSYLVGLAVLAVAWGLAGCGEKPESKVQIPVGSAAPPVASPTAVAPTDALAPRYEATLAEGIDFKKPGYPNFLSEVSGMAGAEPWGRWTDGGVATFKFKQMLPKAFTLKLKAGAWETNLNKPIRFRIGSVEKEFVFKGDPFSGPSDVALNFALPEPADTLQITVPFPVVDKNSPRQIGFGLTSLKIESDNN